MRLMFILLVLACACSVLAQNAQPPRRVLPPIEEFTNNRPADVPTSSAGAEYRIGSDDLIDVVVFEAPDLGGTGRVSASGVVSLPLIGTVQVLGKTTQEVERALEDVLKVKFVNDPHVTVFVREYASQPVSILGAVKVPSIYQLKGQKSLLDMLAMAQGIDQTTAGKTIQIIRKGQGETKDAETITVDAEDLFQNGKTELNIPIHAGDVINVSQAGSVFLVGEVVHPGEFPLRQGKNVTAGTAVALGSGFTRDAKKAACKIIRVHRDGTKEEIAVNVARIYDGSNDDVPLMPNDILFVPANKVKTGLMRALDTTMNIAVGRIMYSGF